MATSTNRLIVTSIPNRRGMAEVAKHLGYSAEIVKHFRMNTQPDQYPAYICAKKKGDNTFWGSNIAWVSGYRYDHVRYEDYIKQHGLKERKQSLHEALKWLAGQLAELKSSFKQAFPEHEKAFTKLVRHIIR